MHTPVIILGAGHAGLAMSRCLADRSIDHVVLERGEVANSWKKERWDSLRLLTPNWQSRLPGAAYEGDDPDGYMSMPEVISFIEDYAKTIEAPVETQTTVTSVRRSADGYELATSRGPRSCRALVLATGAANVANIPKLAEAVPSSIHTLTPTQYKHAGDLPEGGVLVVGASATGVQLAREIHLSGRPVTLAVGEHVRMPRVYRGRDIQWWMNAAGLLDTDLEQVDDIVRARNVPSPQLVGSPARESLDLNALSALGVGLVGRLVGVLGQMLQFSGSLRNVCSLADLKMNRLLDAIDTWASAQGRDGEFGPVERFEPTQIDKSPRLGLDLESGEIRTILWATGFRPDYSWLDVPCLDSRGRLRHEGGVVDSPGLYALGLPFLRRRKSSFIHGAGDDANDLAAHLAGYLESYPRVARAA